MKHYPSRGLDLFNTRHCRTSLHSRLQVTRGNIRKLEYATGGWAKYHNVKRHSIWSSGIMKMKTHCSFETWVANHTMTQNRKSGGLNHQQSPLIFFTTQAANFREIKWRTIISTRGTFWTKILYCWLVFYISLFCIKIEFRNCNEG